MEGRVTLAKVTVGLLCFLLWTGAAMGSSQEPAAADSPGISGESSASEDLERPPVDMNFQEVDIRDLTSYVGEVTGTNFILGPHVKGQITIVSPTRVPANEVLRFFQSVLEVHGYTMVRSGKMVKIVSSETAVGKSVETGLAEKSAAVEDKLVTQVVYLHYLNPDDAKGLLTPLVSEGGIIVSHPQSGTLTITDFQPNVRRLQKLIKAIDVPGTREDNAGVGK